ncbi:murein hydrolase activator EnvC family protein [Flavobacterium luteum]|uniref:Peptidoglycan DD-metalloendopeptidase family protein n=1 Tax=Flavobacterium luteum TaxID=2026654 RepID=A0A7J5AHM9_9FLAO|nr:peptidoglycan DD-metalloendopeptidase family protein [Flavobacterium luteum]KAB1157025.1 peptidoglycan DD-metalloendopeptidase family protein [Flavobacterium luteum]
MPKFILSLIFLMITSFSWSQLTPQEKLEQRKAQILKEIREKEEQLQNVKSKEKTVVSQLALQTEKIKLKEKLINTTEKQTKLLNNDMYINQININRLKKELVVLKEDYAKMILKSYKSRSEQSRAMFLLSSESFLQAYKRAQYMKQYASYRKTQGQEIQEKSEELLVFNDKIGVQKQEKEKLLEEKQKEKTELEKEKQVQQEIAKSIKKDKKQITAEIKKKQQETRAIDNQIEKLIKAAIAAANKKAADANRKTVAANRKADPTSTKVVSKATEIAESKAIETSTKIVLTTEGQIIANNFKANKGRLPWPVEKGFVSLPYGDQPHPVYKTLIVHNSGVEIATDQGASARAVFGGEVISVMILSPVNKAVMIQHGDYFTVYQNLSSVNVSKGDKVSIKQTLGKIRTNGDSGKTVLKFTISQNTTYNNPAGWLFNM